MSEGGSTHGVSVVLAIELPFWIPIESGAYVLGSGREMKIRNDLWLVTVGNIIDGPFDKPFEYVVNETQVADSVFLQRLTGKSAGYYHKRKLKTTFTRGLEIVPTDELPAVQPGTEAWFHELGRIVFGLVDPVKCDEFLRDINSLIDVYCSYVSVSNPVREVRNVSFFEVVVRVVVSLDYGNTRVLYLTQIAPDSHMVESPHPGFRVRKKGSSAVFRETIRAYPKPAFHQVQWAKALNHRREKRYQEALLCAAIALEALIHQFLVAKGASEKENQAELKKGLAEWIRNLQLPDSINETGEVARLWELRNDVVHKQRVLSDGDIEVVVRGIASMNKVRSQLMGKTDPETVRLEKLFSSFLEPVPIGTAAADSVAGLVPMMLEWRRERDHYETRAIPGSQPGYETGDKTDSQPSAR